MICLWITDIQNALSKSEVLYCEPPAELKRQEQPPPPAFPANYTKKPPFLEHCTEEKHLPKRTPPSRPAPPPPNVMVQQVRNLYTYEILFVNNSG